VGVRVSSPTETVRDVRTEDGFDVAALDAWLREREPDLQGPLRVRQFSGGASNLTYLLSYPGRDLVLRRPPPGVKAHTAHDMAREYRVQAALAPVYPFVPTVVALCQDPAVLGGDFYVMERLEGSILRARIPPELGLDAAALGGLCRSVIDALVELHRVDPAQAGLADLGPGRGYVARQVQGWSERYRAARTPNVPSFQRVMSWLAAHRPDDVATVIVHNDFRLDNVVLAPEDPCRIVGVLDWEMTTLGDPLMDLGNSLAYWVQADDDRFMKALRRQPTDAPGMLTRAEVIDHYARSSGHATGDFTFYEVFGLFRLAVIIQQIYRRYRLRQTRNPAFRHYWLGVHYLDWRCRRIIRRPARA
jgi:aminoglycoside phosphotransferase (APT) family kinase protein